MTQWWARRLRRHDDEHGIVIVWFALLLTTLLAMAAFSVDIGSWYYRASQLQRAADAGATAGVVWLPGDTATAIQTAKDVAMRNGIDCNDASGRISCTITKVSDHRLQMAITDAAVPSYFGKMFVKSVKEVRGATAEYEMPIPLGSPENSFGTGSLSGGGQGGPPTPTYIWAAINGFCTPKEQGDPYMARYDGTATSSCPYPSAPVSPQAYNPEYDSTGYYYDIDVPTDLVSPLKVDAWDPAYQPGSCSSPDIALGSSTTITTNYSVVYAPQPLDHTFDRTPTGMTAAQAQKTYNTGDSTSCKTWVNLFTIPAGTGTAGEYRVRVWTNANETNSNGSNAYALRTYSTSTWAQCTTLSGSSGYSASCPELHGETNLSVFVNQPSTDASFYLAYIGPEYAGKTMDIKLFDPGEGSQYMKIQRPDTTSPSYASFNWSTVPKTGFNDYSGSGTQLNVNGTITPPAGYSSNSQFNDRWLTLQTVVPTTNSDGTAFAGGWYKIQYHSTSSVTDRTTWSVDIQGNPVHLVQ